MLVGKQKKRTQQLTFVSFFVVKELSSSSDELSKFLARLLAVNPGILPGVCKLEYCINKSAETSIFQRKKIISENRLAAPRFTMTHPPTNLNLGQNFTDSLMIIGVFTIFEVLLIEYFTVYSTECCKNSQNHKWNSHFTKLQGNTNFKDQTSSHEWKFCGKSILTIFIKARFIYLCLARITPPNIQSRTCTFGNMHSADCHCSTGKRKGHIYSRMSRIEDLCDRQMDRCDWCMLDQ